MPTWLKIVWASPNSALGLALALASRACRGRLAIESRTLEAHGPLIDWFFRRIPLVPGGASAMTLGHVILGRTQADLDRCRAHELVHVGQYERWGPLFLPAYFVFTLIAWKNGFDPYYDNRFEREAYGQEPT